MSILVTGAAGFIGCNNVLALNERGITDIIAVDNLERGEKYQNLAKCSISDYFDKRDFIARVRDGSAPKPEAIFHQGACWRTTTATRLSSTAGPRNSAFPSSTPPPPPRTARTRSSSRTSAMKARSTSTATPSTSLTRCFAANSRAFALP